MLRKGVVQLFNKTDIKLFDDVSHGVETAGDHVFHFNFLFFYLIHLLNFSADLFFTAVLVRYFVSDIMRILQYDLYPHHRFVTKIAVKHQFGVRTLFLSSCSFDWLFSRRRKVCRGCNTWITHDQSCVLTVYSSCRLYQCTEIV